MLTMPFMAKSTVAYNGPPIRLKNGSDVHTKLTSLCNAANIQAINFSDEYTTSGSTGFDVDNILRGSVANNVITLANAQGRPICANTYCTGMFENFSSLATIDVNRISWADAQTMTNCFSRCYNLQTIPSNLPGAVYLNSAFSYCYCIDKIPNMPNAHALADAFYYCTNITSAHPQNGKYFPTAFCGCNNLRSVSFPNSAIGLNRSLQGCEKIEEPVYIPRSVGYVYCMFQGIAHEQDIYVGNAGLNLYGLLYAKNNDFRVNIHVPNNTCYAYTTANTSVTNGVTWASGDGFVYNAARNIYLYADYVPA